MAGGEDVIMVRETELLVVGTIEIEDSSLPS